MKNNQLRRSHEAVTINVYLISIGILFDELYPTYTSYAFEFKMRKVPYVNKKIYPESVLFNSFVRAYLYLFNKIRNIHLYFRFNLLSGGVKFQCETTH